MNINKGEFFSTILSQEIRDRFCYVDEDPIRGKRLFFENSGGSFRLKSVIAANSEIPSAFTTGRYSLNIYNLMGFPIFV